MPLTIMKRESVPVRPTDEHEEFERPLTVEMSQLPLGGIQHWTQDVHQKGGIFATARVSIPPSS